MESSVRKLRMGQAAAAARQRELERAEGPRPEQAVAEALAAAAVEEVRRRWVRIEQRARLTQGR